MNFPLCLDYETCDEDGLLEEPCFTGKILDSEGRVVCLADNEGIAKQIIEATDAIVSVTAENERLRAAILAAHPSGETPGADPLAVLDTLSREWLEELMRGPVSEIEFADGDVLRKIVWVAGDSDVGIFDGYEIDGSDDPYSDIVAEKDRLRAALAPVAEWHRCYADREPGSRCAAVLTVEELAAANAALNG